MSNNNSILPFGVATARELQETAGITRVEGDSWNQTIGGLIFQGGLCNGAATTFPVPFPKKVLGIYGTNNAPSYDLEGFTPAGGDTNFFWMAIGF